MAMIEPCCSERQLPMLLKQTGNGQVAVFTTNGDVLVTHLFRSVAHLAGPRQRMTLVTQRELTVDVLRKMKYWMQRGWEDGIRLLTQEDQTAVVRTETAGFDERVTVVQDTMVKSDLLAFEGNQGVVVIQGDMLCEVDAGLRSYSIVYAKTADNETVRSLLSPIESRLKLAERRAARKAKKAEEKSESPDGEKSDKSEPKSDSPDGQEIS